MGLISNGSTIFDAGSMSIGGSMVFIKKLTFSGGSTTASFVHGSSGVVLDSTYKEYMFYFKDIHHEEADRNLSVNFSIDGGSNYNVEKTSTYFHTNHTEDGNNASLAYRTGTDIAAGTGAQQLMNGIKGDNDSSGAGYMHLFNPASTTFVKHFIAGTNIMQDNTLCQTAYISGFVNTTSAINAVQFSVNSGELDDGTICLYGIS